MLSGLLLLLVGAGIAAAPPAGAVDDPTRPDARVTHGPSCRPGGLVVEVTAGTSPYFVRLATTRQPGGEDEATITPGTTVVLRTGDVAWGETIDGRLEFAARDGSGDTFVDELDNYSFARPASEDCAAVHEPTQPHPSPSRPSVPTGSSQVPAAGDGTTSTPSPPGEPTAEDAGAPPTLPGGPGSGENGTVEEVASAPAGDDDVATPGPLLVAAGALVATAAGIVTVAGRPRPAARRRPLSGSA